MNGFYIQPDRLDNFTPPDGLYHGTWLLPEMRRHRQQAVVIGDISDMEEFTRSKKNAEYLELAKTLCTSIASTRRMPEFGATAMGFIGGNFNLLSFGFPDRDKGIFISGLFAHHEPVLQNILTYEFNLAPELLWQSQIIIQERTVFDFEELRQKTLQQSYAVVHCDGDLPKDPAMATSLCHTYITSDRWSSTFVKDQSGYEFDLSGYSKSDYRDAAKENTYRMPEGKTVFFNGAMAHSHTLPEMPEELWAQESRSVLIVTISRNAPKLSASQNATLDKNTERQMGILGGTSPNAAFHPKP